MTEKYHERFESVGTEPFRSYYIPFPEGAGRAERREESGRFVSLNGTWGITAYESPLDVPDTFFRRKPAGEIPVPACVQFYGYDCFQYTNVAYPIPFDPPYVPEKNPTFHYTRAFEAKKEGRVYLVFEGVDACFYVYVNGKFVGFSQVAHRLSEFDVTPFIKDGSNRLDVIVLKWCAGTYFEDQDKLRYTGIFRDVYLLLRPEKHLNDYRIRTDIDGTVRFTPYGADAVVTFNGETRSVRDGETAAFTVPSPRLWSAEDPYLYDMTIDACGERIFERVGIRTTEVSGGVFRINGKPVKLMGVNRHETNPPDGADGDRRGYAGRLKTHEKAQRQRHPHVALSGQTGILPHVRRVRLLRDGRERSRIARHLRPGVQVRAYRFQRPVFPYGQRRALFIHDG